MKQPEIMTGGVEKINPMKVLTYDEAHEKVSQIHAGTVDSVSVPGVVKRAKEETEKMVKR